MSDNAPSNKSQLPTGEPGPNTNTAQGQLSTTPSFQSRSTETHTPAPATTTSVDTSNQSGNESARIAELERKLAEASKESSKVRQLQEKLDAIENEKLAEQGKYKELYEKEVAQRKKDLQNTRRELARESLRNLAISEGIIDSDIVDMIPAKNFQYDEETGKFTNIRELLDAHKAAKPHLYREVTVQPTGQAPVVNKPTTGHPGQAPEQVPPSKKDIKNMTRQEYEAEKKQWLMSLHRSRR